MYTYTYISHSIAAVIILHSSFTCIRYTPTFLFAYCSDRKYTKSVEIYFTQVNFYLKPAGLDEK